MIKHCYFPQDETESKQSPQSSNLNWEIKPIWHHCYCVPHWSIILLHLKGTEVFLLWNHLVPLFL